MFSLQGLLASIPALLIALTFHEFAHGYVSYKLGDPTPKEGGRLSLNPLRHLDPIGTISLFLFHFGWAKPVQVNPYYYRKPKQDMVTVALAGPAMNFLLAFLSIFCFYGIVKLFALGVLDPYSSLIGAVTDYLFDFFNYLFSFNLGLGIFNLIPIPPLDGSKFLNAILPTELYFKIMQYERYGSLVLILLLYAGVLDYPLNILNNALFQSMENIVFLILRL